MTHPGQQVPPSDPFRSQSAPPPSAPYPSAPPPSAHYPTGTYQPPAGPFPTSAYNAVVANWGTLPPPRQGTSGWIIALVVIGAANLVTALIAVIIGALVLTSTTGLLADSYLDEGSYGDASDFGPAAVYGDYAASAPFSGLTSVDGLDVGTCFTVDNYDDDFVGDPSVGACDQPHDFEVFAVKTIGGGGYPGYDELSDEAFTTCDDKFEGYIGADYDDSLVEYAGVAPTEKGWESGERALVCAAFLYDTSRDRPLRDSGE